MQFLSDVIDHADDGVKLRYRRLGISAGRGNKLKLDLVKRGWLQQQRVEIGRTRKVMLRITEDGKKALGYPRNGGARESLAHEYWKNRYAQRYAGCGYTVTTEAARAGGRVDVLATRRGKRIGIEIETGQSDVVQNVRNGLRSHFDRVVVVATDRNALEIVERDLAKAGLLIPGRVRVVLQDTRVADGAYQVK